ncbi:MAG: serine/threonine protein kinase [Pseudomonadota bacterium]
MITKIITRTVLALIILFALAFAVLQFLAVSSLNTLIEEARANPPAPPVWETRLESEPTEAETAPNGPLNETPGEAGLDARQEVIFVGNNWQGTITVIARNGYRTIGVIDGIPDRLERFEAIKDAFFGRLLFYGIRHLVGEGNDQYVDDMYSSLDGRRLIVSRPSFADVVAIDTASGAILWRFPVSGSRADHMALSPDGRHVAVSASTGDRVHIIDIATGEEHGQFPSGDSPHENVYSKDGKQLFHASIGNVFSPFDISGGGFLKGRRVFQVVDTESFEIIERFDMRDKLDAAGLEDLSPAVRPMAHTEDEQTFYFQLSFLHGFVEYDRASGTITRKVDLPKKTTLPRTSYVNDSAHHGIAINAADTTLCVAGTMDDYVALVDLETEEATLLEGLGKKPYWVVTDKTGENCYVSWSETDQVSVINYEAAEEIARIDVGDHPQRVREGYIAIAR